MPVTSYGPVKDMFFIEISRSRFKQSKNSVLVPLLCVSGVFYKFLGDFWVYLGGGSFAQRIGKILGEIRNAEDFM